MIGIGIPMTQARMPFIVSLQNCFACLANASGGRPVPRCGCGAARDTAERLSRRHYPAISDSCIATRAGPCATRHGRFPQQEGGFARRSAATHCGLMARDDGRQKGAEGGFAGIAVAAGQPEFAHQEGRQEGERTRKDRRAPRRRNAAQMWHFRPIVPGGGRMRLTKRQEIGTALALLRRDAEKSRRNQHVRQGRGAPCGCLWRRFPAFHGQRGGVSGSRR